MNLDTAHVTWLIRFFGAANYLKWQKVAAGTARPDWLSQVAPWIAFLKLPEIAMPIVLPMFGKEGPICWYGFASTDAAASMMLDELQSFVGPTYCSSTSTWLDVAENDSEQALMERFGRRVCRISARESDRESVQRCLALYRDVLARRPPIPDRAERPFGKIRADFDLALVAGSDRRSQQLIEEMVGTGRVNAEQRKCLEIRRLSGLGRQEELAKDRALIASVVDLSLPPQTIVDLVEALHAVHIEPLREAKDSRALADVFKQQIARHFSPLFKERKGIRRPRVLEAFFLYEMVQDAPDVARYNTLVQAFPEGPEKRDVLLWLEHLAPAKVQQKPLFEQVGQAILDEDYQTAIEIALQGVPAAWAYSALLRCAVEVELPATRARILALVPGASAAVRNAFSDKDKTRLSKLQEIPAVPQPDSDWIIWAQSVREGDARASVALLERAVLDWKIDTYQSEPELCSKFAQILGGADGRSEEIFKRAFPSMVEFFVDRPGHPVRSFLPIYSVLLKVIAWSARASSEELEVSALMARTICAVGPDKETYCECLNDIGEVIKANAAPVNVDWALAVAEIFALYPSQDPELRLRIFMDVFEVCRAAQHRLSPPQRAVLKLLTLDYECGELFAGLKGEPAETTVDQSRSFAGVIGIYTLMEAAGQRATEILKQLLPSATIETNADTVATSRLKHLAKTADVFVFAWKSSTHQAYYCAKDSREHRDILLPQGAGTASLVQTVLDGVRILA